MDSREKLYGVDIVFPCLSFFFSFYLSYMPPADELENIIKRGQFLCYFYQRESRESKTQCLQFKMMQACRKKTSWIKHFSRSNTYVYARNIVIEILSFRFFFFFFFSFSKFHIKIRLQGYERNGRKLAQCYDSLIKRL